MPTVSGLTTFGIIRKRMSDLYADFALRIKDGGVFGAQTTADLPDTFATDPLVQIMTTTTASLHEVWEAVEFYYAQFDPRTAEGVFLDNLHGVRAGVARNLNQNDTSYRFALLASLARPTRNHIESIAAARPDIDCALLLTSTVTAPLEGIPAPGNALVVKGCGTIDYNALAQDIYNSVELGAHQLHGDRMGSVSPTPGSCVAYNFLEADPLFVAIEITGYFTNTCGTDSQLAVLTQSAATLTDIYGGCGLGTPINAASVQAALAINSGFVVTAVKLARRARQLWGMPCTDFTGATTVTVCGTSMPWVSQQGCGFKAGETWCPPVDDCVEIKPWEYIAIDQQFITLVIDATKGGCV